MAEDNNDVAQGVQQNIQDAASSIARVGELAGVLGLVVLALLLVGNRK